MSNYNESVTNHLAIASTVLDEIGTTLANMKDGESFNVSKYAKATAERFGCKDLFVAELVRSAVLGCDEYESVRGRNGGIKRVKQAVAAAPVVESADTETAAETETEISVDVPEDADPTTVAEALSLSNDNSVSSDEDSELAV